MNDFQLKSESNQADDYYIRHRKQKSMNQKFKGKDMRILIVEDDFVSRRLMQMLLSSYGECDIAVNGEEAVKAFKASRREKSPYSLICLDIMMPLMDGQEALKQIRAFEKEEKVHPSKEVRIIMTTALDSPKDVIDAYYRGGCNSYLVKPIDRKKLEALLKEYGFVAKKS